MGASISKADFAALELVTPSSVSNGKTLCGSNRSLMTPSNCSIKVKTAMRIKSSAKYFINQSEEPVIQVEQISTFGNGCLVKDGEGTVICFSKCSTGMANETTRIYRSTPTFQGQAAAEGARTGKNDDAQWFLFAVIKTKKTISSATSIFSVVTGPKDGDVEELYTGQKYANMNMHVVLRQTGASENQVLAKLSMGGMKFSVATEMAQGVDLPAMVVLAGSLTGGGNAAGALAGAGVV
mmetsp:Transcript_46335/g.72495  ORF Transcript_46335/g.72495 Transcript_46335/m.72495 type:complete len:238 (-) Transcript_46335:373-1086(-)|eukprot:CAMPEP_0194570886 /NCGR_PEP_ID=MMETSP0292-20121207/8031_1 /TAXON_ID=39354 /ORGANISM="Heterosigma akashiwo, Strain CCMP2393" /LENGTH=237 /DNA_ID=CAMNT_0039421443 /DNA_START=14 /DNA_END=727 /DNA_ORIENTATION=+